MFVFLRIFLLNQRTWSFHWIFSVVFSKLFGFSVLHRINLIIYDRVAQQCSCLDDAINIYFSQAKANYFTTRLCSLYLLSVNIFINNSIEPIESYLLFYLKNVHTYRAYINYGHEGTHCAIKKYDSKVMPRHNLDSSLKPLVSNASRMIKMKKNTINKNVYQLIPISPKMYTSHWYIMYPQKCYNWCKVPLTCGPSNG